MRQLLILAIPAAAIAALILLAEHRREERPAVPAEVPRAESPTAPPEAAEPLPAAPTDRPRSERPPGPVAEKVEAVGMELAMDDAQRRSYRGLLEAYAVRFDGLHRATDWTRAGPRLQFAADHRRLQEEFDLLVVRLLTSEQARAYAGLPEWERSADLGSVALEIEASRRR